MAAQAGTNVLFQFDSVALRAVQDSQLRTAPALPGLNSSIEGIVVTGSISGASTFALMWSDSSDSSTLAGLLANGTYGQMGMVFAQPVPPQPGQRQPGSQRQRVGPGGHGAVLRGLDRAWRTTIGTLPATSSRTGGIDEFNRFQPGDAVVFSDSAAVFTVSVTGAVSPSSMTFQNQSHAYILTGTGNINTGTLSLTNSGTVIVENTNTFSGLTSIGPGSTLQLGKAGTARRPVDQLLDLRTTAPIYSSRASIPLPTRSRGGQVQTLTAGP